VTTPCGAIRPAIASDGSPAPPAMSNTCWPGPRLAAAMSFSVNGAKMARIVGACFAQYSAAPRQARLMSAACSAVIAMIRFKFQVSSFKFQVSSFKFQVSSFKFQVFAG
jgi:hypothetical protein